MWFAHNPLQLRATATEKLLTPGSYSGTTLTSLASTVSGPIEKPQRSEKNQDKLPSPPSTIPLGQGRAGPQAQTWRGCTHRLLGVTSLPSHSLLETLYEMFSNAFILFN